MRRIEFWPDYGQALLHEEGKPVDIDALGLPIEMVRAARDWLGAYEDRKLEPKTLDEAWVAEGRRLFGLLRTSLSPLGVELVDWEGYWAGADPGSID